MIVSRGKRIGPVVYDRELDWTWKNMIGRWYIKTLAGGFLVDYSGFNNHGTLTSMNSASAYVSNLGNALLFTRPSTQRVEINSLNLGARSSLTFSIWCYLVSIDTTWGNGLFCWGQYNVYTNDIFLYTDTTGKINFQLNNGADGAATTANSLPLNTWNHIVCTYNGAGSTNDEKMQVYLNGVRQSLTFNYTVPSTTSTIGPAFNVFRIGAYLDSINSTVFQWNGLIDDFSIHNRSFVADEVQKLYAGGRGYGFLDSFTRRWMLSSTGFKPYWFRNQQRMIGGGIR